VFITIIMLVLRAGILPCGNDTAALETIDFVMTARDWIERGASSALA
jgi:hypothetical protein